MDSTCIDALRHNISSIRENIANAAISSGRSPADVLLCAACKTRTVDEVRASAGMDIDIFGENHAQELEEKFDAGAYLGKPGHFIGHLQTNKVKKVVGRASLIQSVDSDRLLLAIDGETGKKGLVQDILIEINIGGEASKSGIDEDSLYRLLDLAAPLKNITVKGLMAIPPVCTDEVTARGYFAAMRGLFEKAAGRHIENTCMDILSMGMTGDYPWAVLEGSTMVRIGSGIYGPRDYSKKH